MPRSTGLLAGTALLSLLACPTTAQDSVPLRLSYGTFDPVDGNPPIPFDLIADATARLHIVQLAAPIDERTRTALRRRGVVVRRYLPERAYVVTMDPTQHDAIAGLPDVRWVGPVHPAYKLAPTILRDLADGIDDGPQRHDISLVTPRVDEAALIAGIARIGGELLLAPGGGNLAEARLTRAQLLATARLDQVAWIDPWTAPEEDMALVRQVSGATALESVAGHIGKGVRGHVLEGIFPNHPEFAATECRSAPIGVFDPTPSAHGTATFGILFALGVAQGTRGMLPAGQGLFTHYNYVQSQATRYQLVGALVDPMEPYKAMFQTASWGYARNLTYTSRTAEMDLIIFDHDLPITQANGNSGNPQSRPTSWAKNVLSIGGFLHYENTNFADDCWCFTGSTGPAADGRIKPELSHFYDGVQTVAGAPTGYQQFGGTSASTPIVAGHVGLALELFTDGLFGYAAAPNWQDRFDYTPHFTTTKALLINTARQHAFAGTNHDMARNNQGWGMPDIWRLYQQRDGTLVIDELDVLTQGDAQTYLVFVPPGTAELRATMTHAEPPALPNATPARTNSLDLRVTAPGGVRYWGNNGLVQGMFSTPGGEANDIDTLENVWLQSPRSGLYRVTVRATAIREDAHVETGQVDADFALVVGGVAGLRDRSGMELDLGSTGPGNLTVTLQRPPAGTASGLTLLSLATQRPLAAGHLLGLEADGLTAASVSSTAAPGNVLHFTATANPALYPNAPFAFPPAIATALAGLTLDGIAVAFDTGGAVLGVSNVARITVP